MKGIEVVPFKDRPNAEELTRHCAFVVTHFPAETNNPLLTFAAELGAVSLDGITSATNKIEDSAIHLVQEREHPALDPFHNVMISTTNQYFPLHTDEYFAEHPARFVLLLCVVPSETGGTALVSYIDDIVSDLTPDQQAILREPIYPTQVGLRAILEQSQLGWSVRFNELELERAQNPSGGGPLPKSAREAVISLRRSADTHARRHEMMSGQCLALCNYKALHGRTSFPAGSARLLKRIRVK
jgi:hypothetical protein